MNKTKTVLCLKHVSDSAVSFLGVDEGQCDSVRGRRGVLPGIKPDCVRGQRGERPPFHSTAGPDDVT